MKESYQKFTTEKFLQEYKSKNKYDTCISTCVEQLDNILGGIPKGKVTSILGWTSCFKSTWAINIAYKAQMQGLNTLYLSLEMGEYDVLANLLSRHSNQLKYKYNLAHCDLKRKELREHELEYLESTIIPDYNKLERKSLYCGRNTNRWVFNR